MSASWLLLFALFSYSCHSCASFHSAIVRRSSYERPERTLLHLVHYLTAISLTYTGGVVAKSIRPRFTSCDSRTTKSHQRVCDPSLTPASSSHLREEERISMGWRSFMQWLSSPATAHALPQLTVLESCKDTKQNSEMPKSPLPQDLLTAIRFATEVTYRNASARPHSMSSTLT